MILGLGDNLRHKRYHFRYHLLFWTINLGIILMYLLLVYLLLVFSYVCLEGISKDCTCLC